MSASNQPSILAKNRLLAALPKHEYERLLPQFELVTLPLKQILYKPNEPIEYVYFLNHGVGSLINIMEDGTAVETATVGNEGMVGVPVFLETYTMPIEAIVQVPGAAMRMRADVFKALVTQGSLLHRLVQLYTQALINQIMQSAACNRLHLIEERCCRWLLMTRDRVESDEFTLTQEFLSDMLGVRRPSVSVVSGILQKQGLIRYSRGKITILDRQGLEAASCECYRVIKKEYERLLGGNGT